MNLIQRTLTTLGLVTALAGCGAAQQPNHGPPQYDWSDALYLDAYTLEDVLPDGQRSEGNLRADGAQCLREPCYDVVIRSTTTDATAQEDLAYARIDTRIIDEERQESYIVDADFIFVDDDQDGTMDRFWAFGTIVDDSGRSNTMFQRQGRISVPTDNLVNYIVESL